MTLLAVQTAVAVGATNKAIVMGAGDDTVTVNASALGVSATLGNGSIDAGTGTDTLVMTGANAATAYSRCNIR